MTMMMVSARNIYIYNVVVVFVVVLVVVWGVVVLVVLVVRDDCLWLGLIGFVRVC